MEEIIDHLFKTFDLAKSFWSSIDINCPSSNNNDSSFIDWLEHIWKYKSWCNKIFNNLLEKIIPMTWVMWNHRNKVIFRNYTHNHVSIIEHAMT